MLAALQAHEQAALRMLQGRNQRVRETTSDLIQELLHDAGCMALKSQGSPLCGVPAAEHGQNGLRLVPTQRIYPATFRWPAYLLTMRACPLPGLLSA